MVVAKLPILTLRVVLEDLTEPPSRCARLQALMDTAVSSCTFLSVHESLCFVYAARFYVPFDVAIGWCLWRREMAPGECTNFVADVASYVYSDDLMGVDCSALFRTVESVQSSADLSMDLDDASVGEASFHIVRDE
eukprot:1307628-Rhodomonas_salina.1